DGIRDCHVTGVQTCALPICDLRRTDTGYRLSDRLLGRQRRQDDALRPHTRVWHGDWEMVVITATGRGPAERADLRTRLTALRLEIGRASCRERGLVEVSRVA